MSQTKFSPQLQDPSYVPAVQGGNEAVGHLERAAEKAASFLGEAVEIVDQNNIRKVKLDAEGSAAGFGAEVLSSLELEPDERQRLSRLGMAVAQKALSPNQLAFKVHSEAKYLKSKYPGYEDIVDREIDNRVYGGTRGRVIQAMFSELDAEEKARKQAAEDRDAAFKEMRQNNAAIIADVHSTDVYEYGGVLYDFTASENKLLKNQAKQYNLEVNAKELAYSENLGAAERARKARAFSSSYAKYVLDIDAPIFMNWIRSTAYKLGGPTKEDLLNAEQLKESRKQQALASMIEQTGMSVQDANEALQGVFKTYDNAVSFMSSNDIDVLNVSKLMTNANSSDFYYSLAESQPMLYALEGISKSGAPPEAIYNLMRTFIDGSENGRAITQAVQKAIEENKPVSQKLAEMVPEPEEKEAAMKEASKQASIIYKHTGLNSKQAALSFAQALSATASGKQALLTNPETGQMFLRKFYDGSKAKTVIKALKPLQGSDPSVDDVLDISKELALQSIVKSYRQILGESGSDTRLQSKGDLSKVLNYDISTGTFGAPTKRRNTFIARGGSFQEVDTPNPALVQVTKDLQIATDILVEMGEKQEVDKFLIEAGLIPDPAKETKGGF